MNWSEEIPLLVRKLDTSGLALLPTDTVWGLCGDATDPVAIHRILKLKRSEPGSGLVCLVSGMDMLKEFVPQIHPRLETLLAYVRRPLTVLHKEVRDLPEILRGPRGEVALRMVRDPWIAALVEEMGRPLVATLPAKAGAEFEGVYADIEHHVIEGVDHIAAWRRGHDSRQVSVMVRLDGRLELEFVRS